MPGDVVLLSPGDTCRTATDLLSTEMAKRWFYDGNLDDAGVVPRRP